MKIKLSVTACAIGTLTSDSRQQIRSAVEAELRRGIRPRHLFFDNLIRETAEAAAKAMAADPQ